MKNLERYNNKYGDDKVHSNCSLFGMMDTSGSSFSGRDIVKAMENMHDRGNGLGAGFAVYGVYPDFREFYAMHIMYDIKIKASEMSFISPKEKTEAFIKKHFRIVHQEEIETQQTNGVNNPPLFYRYFVRPDVSALNGKTEDEYVIEKVTKINTEIEDTYVFSSGKNMGVFKGVGYPEDIARFFCLENYSGYIWTAHSRFPTNSQGWWGGAHPFSILDWTVVHNGEISSYGINRRYLEMHGYRCTMGTDTEVVAYAVDLLSRRHNISLKTVMDIFSPPIWSIIDHLSEEKKEYYTTLRQVYGSLLMNGPFAVIIAHHGEMIGHTDRIRLRPMVAGTKGNMLYISSEEAAMRLICPDLERSWIPVGGHPITGRLKKKPTDENIEYSDLTWSNAT